MYVFSLVNTCGKILVMKNRDMNEKSLRNTGIKEGGWNFLYAMPLQDTKDHGSPQHSSC